MGNSHQRYFTNNDAIEIIGGERWMSVKSKLDRYSQSGVDFTLFSTIIHSRFEKMPNILCESLYKAFAIDVNHRTDVDSFISSLAVLASEQRPLIMRFLYRIYESDSGVLERKRIEDILRIAYGEKLDVKRASALKRQLDEMFDRGTKLAISLKEMELFYSGPFNILAEWVVKVLKVFVEKPPQRLETLEKRYSSALECDEMRSRFDIDKSTCEQLRSLFYGKCYSSAASDHLLTGGGGYQTQSSKAELSPSAWLEWVAGSSGSSGDFLCLHLAGVIFDSKTTLYKTGWRFADFVEFAVTFGAGSLQEQTRSICRAYADVYAQGRAATRGDDCVLSTGPGEDPSYRRGFGSLRQALEAMVADLAIAAGTEERAPEIRRGDKDAQDVHQINESDVVEQSSEGNKDPEKASSAVHPHHSLNARRVTSSPSPKQPSSSSFASRRRSEILPPVLVSAMQEVGSIWSSEDQDEDRLLAAYEGLLLQHVGALPGLRDLAVTACCLLGVQPGSPRMEKEFVTELTLRHMHRSRVSKQHPVGVVGTEWCLVCKSWYDRWRVYVGHQHMEVGGVGSPKGGGLMTNTKGGSGKTRPPKPGAIDNWSIVRKHGPRGQLLQGVISGQDFEVIAPAVYAALYLWYGGGVRVSRRVVSNGGVGGAGSEIEYFPLCVKFVSCDAQGRTAPTAPIELLFSRTATIENVIAELCHNRSSMEPEQVRLWNYAQDHPKDQFVLTPPQLTLEAARVQDGQTLLVEVSLANGSWPRSQLQATLGEGPAETGAPTGVSTAVDNDTLEEVGVAGSSSESGRRRRRACKGLVGLDNLGNTCYLNSSLQALLHTDLLVDYFLSQAYLRDINVRNIHGFKGRLANSFGRLVAELYSSEKKHCVSPRHLMQTIAALRDQFAGNDQHDAQELLAFLLDGLSEDLSLVPHLKPYIEQPDSDGRPEAEVADIWWRNHLLRDHSIVQALFTGQFQSLMRCSCGYSSARFEPFTCLTVPVPEESYRAVTVVVVPLRLREATRVSVRVSKSGLLGDVVQKVAEMRIGETAEGAPGSKIQYLAGEMANGRIRSFNSLDRRIDTIRESDCIALFQVQDDAAESDAQATEAVLLDSSHIDRAVLSHPSYAESHRVRVGFVHRHVKLVSGASVGAAGFDLFRPEHVGVSFLEVLPEDIRASDLYALVEARVRPFLKAPVSDLTGRSLSALRRSASSTQSLSNSPNAAASDGCAESPQQVCSVPTDEVVGGTVPPTGFTLRMICGGITRGASCSRCPWLSRCQGCCIPNSPDLELTLCDGECLSIDWHVAVFEELVDVVALTTIGQHASVDAESTANYESKVPLSRCLDKFTESEPLDGVVCPKCASSSHMSKSFRIWRQPPILIVQIKRFQFDSTARRKLYTAIDFPLDGLDVRGYMAQGAPAIATETAETKLPQPIEHLETAETKLPQPIEHLAAAERMVSPTPARTCADDVTIAADAAVRGLGEDSHPVAAAVGCVTSVETTPAGLNTVRHTSYAPSAHNGDGGGGGQCTEYDLYSAIHHLGALGGGHYVTAVRDSSLAKGAQWHCYNDHLVTPVTDEREVCSPSAYVLFYVRRDVKNADFSDLLRANSAIVEGGWEMEKSTVVLDSPPPMSKKDGPVSTAVIESEGQSVVTETGRFSRNLRVLGRQLEHGSGRNATTDVDKGRAGTQPSEVRGRPLNGRPNRSENEGDQQCTLS